jgi:ATP synthase protein I
VSARMALVDKKLALRLLTLQALIIVFASALLLMQSPQAAWSFLTGGAIAVIAHGYFAYKAFAFSGARAAKQIMRGFYVGEAGKVAITALMFMAAFKWLPEVQTKYLMTGFFLALLLNWLAPLVANFKR